MRELALLRHAKSSWDDPSLADVDRPLGGRGRRAGRAMAAYLAEHPLRPALILCSPAVRARETLALVTPSLGEAVIRYPEELYTFDGERVIRTLRGLEAGPRAVLVVGHEPAMHEVATMLAVEGRDLAALRTKFPTGALAVLELSVDAWADVHTGCGRLAAFVRPRDLS